MNNSDLVIDLEAILVICAFLSIIVVAGLLWYRTVGLAFIEMQREKKTIKKAEAAFDESFQKLPSIISELKRTAKEPTKANEIKVVAEKTLANLKEMNFSFGKALNAVSEMSDASKDAPESNKRIQAITKNLVALNSMYELELKDSETHVKNMNKFYESLTGAMQGLSKDDANDYKSELGKLTNNLASLNNMYQNILNQTGNPKT
jgi:gliding motility-associated protein GldL